MASPQTEAVTPRAAETGPDRPRLVMTGITKRFPGADTPVLDGIDLTLYAGRTVSVKGQNGAGKTTLMRIVAGLIKPDAGTIALDGIGSEAQPGVYRPRIGLLSAGSTGLFARLSVGHHLGYFARLALLSRDQRGRAVERALDTFNLHEFAARRADRLSMGQRQRVRAAVTFLHDPDVVLLDEPQTSLDAEGIAMLDRVVADLLERGGAVLWCSPAGTQNEIDFNQAFVLEGGRLKPE
ncbi:MAG: ATP-binding cassette domain-containing protein [Thermoleophilaceae bacterium]